MTYDYYTKDIYGKQHYIIVEDGFSQRHFALTGGKTLLVEKHFQLYGSIGIKFNQVLPPRNIIKECLNAHKARLIQEGWTV